LANNCYSEKNKLLASYIIFKAKINYSTMVLAFGIYCSKYINVVYEYKARDR